ncbi:ankyrin repeat-containing domain protein [Pelagophyceae sp. CCMP2097]|nr:ankyrin repeat-containing domain protein [Pelagophyceae sp. CCMP2097]
MSGSSLREAAQQGDLRYLNVLLKGGSNPCSSDADGLTALHFASWNGHVDCVEALCVNDLGHATQRSKPLKGDDEETASKRMVSCINLRTRAGWSALHIAAMGAFDAARVVSLLLAMGCDSRALDAKGLLACDVAKMHDSLDAAEILDAPRESPFKSQRPAFEPSCRPRPRRSAPCLGGSNAPRGRHAQVPSCAAPGGLVCQ